MDPHLPQSVDLLLACGRRRVEVIAGSMLDLPTDHDVLVSPDDNYLSHGGGLSRELWKLAGPSLIQEIRASNFNLHLGDVYPTSAGKLRARYLLHAISVDFDAGTSIDSGNSSALVRDILVSAERLRAKSVAIPMISTGSLGGQTAAFADAFINAVTAWSAGPSSLESVALVVLPALLSIILPQLKTELGAVISAEALVENLEPPFGAIGQEWLMTAELPPDERSSVFLLIEQVCRTIIAVAGLRPREATGYNLSSLIGQVVDLLDDLTATTLRDAWLLRNQILHTQNAKLGDVLDKANSAMYQLLNWTEVKRKIPRVKAVVQAFDPLSQAMPSDELPHLGSGAALVYDFKRLARSASMQGPGLSGSASTLGRVFKLGSESEKGTGSVRELRAFVDRHLKGKRRDAFFRGLNAEGYVGTDEVRLLELLIRETDLDHWLATWLDLHVLQQELRERGLSPVTKNPEELARQLLESMAFPCPRRFKGIDSILLELENIQNELLIQQFAYEGPVGRAAKLVEYLCHVVVRFLCMAAFEQAPEIYLRANEKLQGNDKLELCTLGKLLELVEFLKETIEHDHKTASVERFKSVLDRNPLPERMSELARIRNSFVHYKERRTQPSEAEKRNSARSFINDAVNLAKAVKGVGTGLFPMIIRVDSITVDRWGRRTVVAYRDDNRRETIFTDQRLEAGRVYFMLPFSNPLRVDPLLIPAGTLWTEPD